jgi:hypothetical protein
MVVVLTLGARGFFTFGGVPKFRATVLIAFDTPQFSRLGLRGLRQKPPLASFAFEWLERKTRADDRSS